MLNMEWYLLVCESNMIICNKYSWKKYQLDIAMAFILA